jgi:plasmid stabilization system protein ParE
MIGFTLTVESQRDLDEATEWYELQKSGLGRRFAEDILVSINSILAFPNAWPKVARDSRCRAANSFPYLIVYRQIDDMIYITAIVHMKRHPSTWRSRLKST